MFQSFTMTLVDWLLKCNASDHFLRYYIAGRSKQDAMNDAAKYLLKSMGDQVPLYKEEVMFVKIWQLYNWMRGVSWHFMIIEHGLRKLSQITIKFNLCVIYII